MNEYPWCIDAKNIPLGFLEDSAEAYYAEFETVHSQIDEDEWSDSQFVIGGINAIQKCYNSLILAHTPRDGNRRAASIRAVVVALTGEVSNPRHIVYEWGWALDAEVKKAAPG